ncbi:MAG: (4Fe-4S)-binding protein [Dethiobacteria bacterium]
MEKKKVKAIKIDINKCTGCRSCEIICSASHATPKYSSVNPARSRIRIIKSELENIFIPVIASHYTNAECNGRNIYKQNNYLTEKQWDVLANKKEHAKEGTEFGDCAFCGASCPSRDLFKEPDSGLPLRCDLCEGEAPGEEPLCVRWCMIGALTYEEREEEIKEGVELDEMEIGLQALVDKYGLLKVADNVSRMLEKD